MPTADQIGYAQACYAHVAALTGNETLMILAPNPLDETLYCGGLIAACCRMGQPPFVMVLADGSQSQPHSNLHSPEQLAAAHERETREAARRLGLPDGRLLMAGLFDGSIPTGGPVFEALVRAVTLVMWARDCNVLCAPWAGNAAPHHGAAARIAAEVARRSGVGLLSYAASAGVTGIQLDIAGQLAAKQAAMAAHATLLGPGLPGGTATHEVFVR